MRRGGAVGPMRWPVVAVVLLDLVVIAALGYVHRRDPNWLVFSRAALFTRFVEDPTSLAAGPVEMREAGFSSDSPAAIADWRRRLGTEADWVAPALSVEGSTASRVSAMVPMFSRNGGLTCGVFGGLADKFARIGAENGYGCCSDHSEVMLALLAMAGIDGREVHHSSHTFVEFYAPESNGWVWVDPQYALMARDEEGRLLSLVELRDSRLSGRPVEFEFIGSDYHEFHDRSPLDQRFYDEPSDFADLTVTWGNDVFAQARWNERLGPLPKSVRQGLGLLAGEVPGYVTIDDGRSDFPGQLRSRQRLLWTAFVVLVAVHAGALAVWLRSRRPDRSVGGPSDGGGDQNWK